MLTFMVMFASIFGMSAIKKEQRLRTESRVLSAPVRRWQYLTGKVAGGLAATSVQVTVALLFSRYVLGAYWGEDMITVGLVLMCEVLMAVSIGAVTAFVFKAEATATGILNTIFPLLATFGGNYVPLSVMPPVMVRITDFNPLAWVNRAVMGIIYNRDYSPAFISIGLCLGISAVFLALTALLSRKETA
jgi:ABC-2 type transport system permease protein